MAGGRRAASSSGSTRVYATSATSVRPISYTAGTSSPFWRPREPSSRAATSERVARSGPGDLLARTSSRGARAGSPANVHGLASERRGRRDRPGPFRCARSFGSVPSRGRNADLVWLVLGGRGLGRVLPPLRREGHRPVRGHQARRHHHLRTSFFPPP